MAGRAVYIGCSSAFWGDSSLGAWQLVNKAENLDYLVADYLAEVTMGILASVKARGGARGGMGDGGYVAEFVDSVWKPLMKQIVKRNIKVVTNAGGLSPLQCKEAIEKLAKEAGIEISVAAVHGDDITEKIPDFRENGDLKLLSVEGDTEELWPKERVMLSANTYFGALPIAEALRQGAQIVVTGRCADSALVLGPLMFEFGWTKTSYDQLSAGSLAGHVIECGCQATGGNFTDWRLSLKGGWEDVGFPVVECFEDGSFIVTKPPKTGGIVTRATVAEQMIYEIHNPAAYILPDVICDWRFVTIDEIGENRVRVRGAKGNKPTPFYKISATSVHGYKMSGELLIGGIEAAEKAKAVGEAILNRTRGILKQRGLGEVLASNIEVLGAEHTYGPHARNQNSREVILRLSVVHDNPKALGVFGKEVAPAATSMAPGITGAGSGRPRPQPLLHHHSCLISKNLVPVSVAVGTNYQSTKVFDVPEGGRPASSAAPSACPFASNDSASGSCPRNSDIQLFTAEEKAEPFIEVPLIAIAYGRSGDKGDIADVGIFTRKKEYYHFLISVLTEEAVRGFFNHLIQPGGVVKRFFLPGICGLNFILTRSLGGGGLASLNIDRQAKTYAQMLLSFPVKIPTSWAKDWPRSRL